MKLLDRLLVWLVRDQPIPEYARPIMKADPDVQLLQAGLKFYGYDPGPLDGIPGPKTDAAKIAWRVSLNRTGASSADAELLRDRWRAASIRPERLPAVAEIVAKVLVNQSIYEQVTAATGVPWFVIACLHNMESGGNFRCHLHEGSPLTGRTKNVPKGRPLTGSPPFSWEESAIDALRCDRLDLVDWTRLPEMLYGCERYNGLGYLRYHRDVPSPYLWGATTVERPGKYTADGKWSATATTKQVGVAAILKRLADIEAIELPPL